MIQITLKELNDSFQSLNSVGESLTAGKMKYRFARTLKSAKDHVELLGKSLAQIAEKHGAELNGGERFSFDSEKQKEELKAFNREASDFLKTEKVEVWGDPQFFTIDEIEKAVDSKKPISASDISNLLWLISLDEGTEPEPEKARAATA